MPIHGTREYVTSIAGQLHPRLSRACHYLALLADTETPEHRRFVNLAEGDRMVVELEGAFVRAIHEVYRPRPLAQARLEVHHCNADIQFVLSGSETILTAEKPGPLLEKFNEDSDIGFFTLSSPWSTTVMNPGSSMLIMPGELHAPGILLPEATATTLVRKCVIKIASY